MTQREVLLIDSGHQAFADLVAGDIPSLSASYDAAGAAAAAQTAAATDATTKANAAAAAAEAASAPVGRTLTAGTGLTGGGDLSANRSFAADFGSTSGKITQGNDSRLSDSRAPNGSAGGSLSGTYPNPAVATNANLTGDVTSSGNATTIGSGKVTAQMLLDQVFAAFGAPDTAFEFNTSSLTGLTQIGSPAAEDANTTVPSCLYLRSTDSTVAWNGRYLASPATPFTAITKILSASSWVNFNYAAIFLAAATPVALATNEFEYNAGLKIVANKYTNRTTFSAQLGAGPIRGQVPVYLGVVVNSTTSVDYYISFDGVLWAKYLAANNPSITIGAVGLAMKSENALGFSVAFDYLRIWNSAKTFPGA